MNSKNVCNFLIASLVIAAPLAAQAKNSTSYPSYGGYSFLGYTAEEQAILNSSSYPEKRAEVKATLRSRANEVCRFLYASSPKARFVMTGLTSGESQYITIDPQTSMAQLDYYSPVDTYSSDRITRTFPSAITGIECK